VRGHVSRIVLVALAAFALAAGAIAANVLLLGYADSPGDPVGKLSPRATITQGQTTATTSPPVQTTTDDHHSRTSSIEGPDD
jgi:hypothetical protein